MKYIYGPIPSRRLGKSLGISPISKKICNLSCVYCQLGLTDKMTNNSVYEYDYLKIISELKEVLNSTSDIDCITIVGEGEPTLYLKLEVLIDEIKKITDKPIAVITNGTRFTEKEVYQALLKADIVLPSIDAYDEISFKKINRPHKNLKYDDIINSLIKFSNEYRGQIWLETMVCKDYNDSEEALKLLKELADKIKHSRYYLNSPVRPPALKSVKTADHQKLEEMAKELDAINIDALADPKFYSHIKDNLSAILSIIRRHPMNQFDIKAFLDSRGEENTFKIFDSLKNNQKIETIKYKGYDTYRYKMGEEDDEI